MFRPENLITFLAELTWLTETVCLIDVYLAISPKLQVHRNKRQLLELEFSTMFKSNLDVILLARQNTQTLIFEACRGQRAMRGRFGL